MKLLSFNTGPWHITLSVIVRPEQEGLIMCGEFPVTCSPVDLKGQISYQFISSYVQREI